MTGRRDESTGCAVSTEMMRALALAFLCGGCGSSAPATPSPSPSAQPKGFPTFDCGTLRPNLYSFCVDGTPPHMTENKATDEMPLPEGPAGYDGYVQIKSCDLGVTAGDAGSKIEADLSVTCLAPAATSVLLSAEVTLDGTAERRCAPGPYGSGASAKPYWHAKLRLPGESSEKYRIAITADATQEITSSCVVTFADRAGDPLSPGSGIPVVLAFEPPGSYDLVVDCSAGGGLVGTNCQGFVEGGLVSAPSVSAHLRLVLGATRCDASGCLRFWVVPACRKLVSCVASTAAM